MVTVPETFVPLDLTPVIQKLLKVFQSYSTLIFLRRVTYMKILALYLLTSLLLIVFDSFSDACGGLGLTNEF